MKFGYLAIGSLTETTAVQLGACFILVSLLLLGILQCPRIFYPIPCSRELNYFRFPIIKLIADTTIFTFEKLNVAYFLY